MTCKQKLCQRSKNLKHNVNRSICDDVIAEATKNDENLEPMSSENVEVDLKLMINTHNKLAQGIPVDANAVSALLLGGIINIINQHDKIEHLEKKMKNVLMENNTNKIRLEIIENWVQRQDNLNKKLDEKLSFVDKNGIVFKENHQIEIIQKKLSRLEAELSLQKESLKRMQT